MMGSKNNKIYLDSLKLRERQWSEKEEAKEDPDFRQEWVEEGIEIYKELTKGRLSREEHAMYNRILADLYLEYGRSEKLISGNNLTAFRYLQKAARVLPEVGDTFYHLAFLAVRMTPGREKWESVAFYAKEALERGVEMEKEIKIWCLLGKAYQELGFVKDAVECFEESKKLDRDDDYSRFRMKYSKKEEEESFVRLEGKGNRISKRDYLNQLIERSRSSQCFILKTNSRGATLYGNGTQLDLTSRQAELLKLIFEYKSGLTKEEILNNTAGVGSRQRNPETIKTDISRLRGIISQYLEFDGNQLLQTIRQKELKKTIYRWNPEIEHHLIE